MVEIILTSGDKGKTQTARIGDTVVIRLPENPTTGYRWLLQEINRQVLLPPDPDNIEFALSPDSAIGGGGIRTFKFKAKSPGTSIIRLIRKRNWEPDNSAEDFFNLTLIVQ